MPSAQPLPTIDDFVNAGHDALRGECDTYGDKVSGSLYDHTAGPTAILFSREVQNDQDLFKDIYFQDASSDALSNLVLLRWNIPRILSTAGTGTCLFRRTSAAAGAGTLWTGSRIQVPGAPAPSVYAVSSDTVASASATTLTVPIQASVFGKGSAIAAISGGLQLLDPLYDPLWQPYALYCGDGTDYEAASDFRSRVQLAQLIGRNGYIPKIVQTCQAQGAQFVLCFASNYGLDNTDSGFANDFGLNAVYVGDANFQSTPTMIQNCAVALDSVRVLGADLWVGGFVQSPLFVQAVVALIDQPSKLETVVIQRNLTQALINYFAGTSSGYTIKRDALESAMRAAHPAVQQVTQWLSPSADVALSPNSWPANLTRYTLAGRAIQLSFVGPQ